MALNATRRTRLLLAAFLVLYAAVAGALLWMGSRAFSAEARRADQRQAQLHQGFVDALAAAQSDTELLKLHDFFGASDESYHGFRVIPARGGPGFEAWATGAGPVEVPLVQEIAGGARIELHCSPAAPLFSGAKTALVITLLAQVGGVLVLVWGWGRSFVRLQEQAVRSAHDLRLELGTDRPGDLGPLQQVLEATIASLRTRQAELAERADVPMAVFDPNTAAGRISAGARTLLGIAATEEAGAALRELGARVHAPWPEGGGVHTGEVAWGQAGLTIGVTAVAIGSDQPGAPLWLFLFEDRTSILQRRRAEATREQLAWTGEMAAAVAHEIRNAMGTMLAQVRLLERGQDTERLLPRLAAEIHSVARLTKDYITLSRPLDPAGTVPVPLRSAIERVLSDLAAEGLARAHPVEFEGDFPEVRGDGPLLERVLDNLLRNAFQAMEAVPDAGLRISTYLEEDALILAIEDKGPGLGAERPSDVFKPFVSAKAGGTGLGLTFARRAIEAMGATIRALDNPRGGAILLIRFPPHLLCGPLRG